MGMSVLHEKDCILKYKQKTLLDIHIDYKKSSKKAIPID